MHTPGPWNTCRGGVEGPKGEPICAMQFNASKGVTLETCKDNERLIAAAPEMYKALEATLCWMTNVNTNDPATLGRQIMAALESAGYDNEALNDAAVALVRGPCAVPNLMGDDDVPSAHELLELLDNVSAAFESVMTKWGISMEPADYKSRWALVRKARAVCDEALRPEHTCDTCGSPCDEESVTCDGCDGGAE